MLISESRILKIADAVEKAEKLKAQGKETKRKNRYVKIYDLAESKKNGLGNGLGKRCLVICKDCSSWCKRRGKNPIIWPSTEEGKVCPLCEEGKLTRVSIL